MHTGILHIGCYKMKVKYNFLIWFSWIKYICTNEVEMEQTQETYRNGFKTDLPETGQNNLRQRLHCLYYCYELSVKEVEVGIWFSSH